MTDDLAPLPSIAGISTGDWTDANVHDPGITLLELLAFAAGALFAARALRRWRRRRKI